MNAVVRTRNVRIRSNWRARLAARAGTVGELVQLLASSGRWWLLPMVVVLGLTAALLVAVAAVEYVAPFVYTVF